MTHNVSFMFQKPCEKICEDLEHKNKVLGGYQCIARGFWVVVASLYDTQVHAVDMAQPFLQGGSMGYFTQISLKKGLQKFGAHIDMLFNASYV